MREDFPCPTAWCSFISASPRRASLATCTQSTMGIRCGILRPPGRTAEDLTAFANNIKENGAKAGYQLATMGCAAFRRPSSISDCMDMTAEEISNLIADTFKAAATLKRCGFDCVQRSRREYRPDVHVPIATSARDDYGPPVVESRPSRARPSLCKINSSTVSRRTTRPSATTPFSLPLKRTKTCSAAAYPIPSGAEFADDLMSPTGEFRGM